jgi:hypothetical protein
MKVSLFCLGILLLFSCKSNPAPTPVKPVEKTAGYLAQADISFLASEADFVDIIFYQMDISVSQNDPASVQQTTQFLTLNGKPSGMNCPAIGRLTYLSKGKIIREADIHVQGTACAYFTLIENKKPVGTCLISPDGLKFFDSLIGSYQPPK